MKRLVLMTILKLCGEAILIAMIVGIVIGVIGALNKWDTSRTYSDAFFVAGSLVMVAGGLSRMASGQEWGSFQLLYAESFRHMSSGERANYIINASSSLRLVILGLLSGILLILVSALVLKLF